MVTHAEACKQEVCAPVNYRDRVRAVICHVNIVVSRAKGDVVRVVSHADCSNNISPFDYCNSVRAIVCDVDFTVGRVECEPCGVASDGNRV